MRPIDADALLEVSKSKQSETEETAYNFLNCAQNPSTEWDCVEDMIENAPTIEPEVRHGRWVTIFHDTAKCLCCGWWQSTTMYYLPDDIQEFSKCYKFCTACGARMDVTETNVCGKGGADK